MKTLKPAAAFDRAGFFNNPGDFLLSHTVTRAVPSAPAPGSPAAQRRWGGSWLNFRVRDGNGCEHGAVARPLGRAYHLAKQNAAYRSMRDFDDNEFPLAYLITFRCYGSWFHGDARSSMDRKHNVYGTPKLPANRQLETSDAMQLKHPLITLDARRRKVVERAVKDVCDYRDFTARAINVRTNHVHTVVTAMSEPEPVLNAFKSYATRALRKAGLLSAQDKPWARHGSTIYLWKERDVAKAIEYVMLGQGEELFRLDD